MNLNAAQKPRFPETRPRNLAARNKAFSLRRSANKIARASRKRNRP